MNLLSGKLLTVATLLVFAFACQAQNPPNWTSKQLMEPAELASSINSKKNLPVIISIGPAAPIPHSIDIGMVNTKQGIDKFKAQLNKLDKDKKVVVYCGCCPFENCPNVRPAVKALNDLKFTNFYVLNLPHNIRRDWIDKGYPLQ